MVVMVQTLSGFLKPREPKGKIFAVYCRKYRRKTLNNKLMPFIVLYLQYY